MIYVFFKLGAEYNRTLDSYLKNYENYLLNKSRLINDSPKLANKYKYLILQDNQKLLEMIRALYDNIKYTDKQNMNTRLRNNEKRNAIKKNKKILETQKSLLLQDKDELLTKEERINHLETLYRGKYKTYTGILITDIVIGILLMLMLIFSFQ